MNDFVLKVSYYGGVLLTLFIATTSYLWLRSSFSAAVGDLPFDGLRTMFRRALFPTIVFSALAGFFSVSVRGCSGKSYDAIAADHAFIVRRSQAQFSDVLLSLSVIFLVWGFLLAVAVILWKRRTEE